jgi:LysM repeat protein
MFMRRCRLHAAVAIVAVGLVTACETEPPALTATNETMPEQVAKREPRQIIVQPGQSVSLIAAKYQVPQRAIIAANDLTPPYKIKIGQQLLVPSADAPPAISAVAGSSPSSIEPIDLLTVPGPMGLPLKVETAAGAPTPNAPTVNSQAAAPASDKSFELSSRPVAASTAIVTAPVSSDSASAPAPANTAAGSVPSEAPPGVTCPPGTVGLWSHDVVAAVYVCKLPQS